MIKKFIDKLLGKTRTAPVPRRTGRRPGQGQAGRGAAGRARHRPDAGRRARGARGADARRGRLRGLHRRRRGARPAARPAAEGLRRRHQRHARAGQGPVPPRLHHRPALPHRARGVRPRPRARGDRGLDLPRVARRRRRRAGRRQREDLARPSSSGKSHVVDARAACCATTSGARRIEDAARRDFTVNAMYYDPLSQIVVDYHGGIWPTRARRCCA